jgi:hypothetical protein
MSRFMRFAAERCACSDRPGALTRSAVVLTASSCLNRRADPRSPAAGFSVMGKGRCHHVTAGNGILRCQLEIILVLCLNPRLTLQEPRTPGSVAWSG